MNKPITLNNLTPEHVEMLDFMWSLESQEELQQWQSCLDQRQLQMSQSLLVLLMQEIADELIVEDLSAARAVLQKFTL